MSQHSIVPAFQNSIQRLPPLIPFTLAFILGIALDFELHAGLPWVAAVAAVGAALCLWRREAILLLAVGLGLGIHHFHRAAYSEADVRNIFGDRPDIIECEGRICGDPVARPQASGSRLDFPVKLRRFRPEAEWKDIRGEVLVRWERPDAGGRRLFWGDRVRITGYLAPPEAATNPYVFDYRAYLGARAIHYILEVDRDDAAPVLLESSAAMRAFFGFRDRLEQALLRGIDGSSDDQVRGLIAGMILGERTQLHPEVNENFRRTGTLHVIAISGLHITLIAFLIGFVLRMLRLPRRAIALLVIPFLAAYVAMTGCQPSAVRALVMCVVFLSSWLFNRPAHLMNTVAVAAFVILLFAPYELFDAGFQLSFLVVAALVLLVPRIRGRFEPWIEVDPFLPRDLVLPRQRRTARCLGWAADLVSVSLAAWAGSAGLILYYFHLFSPMSVLCNLVVVPLSSCSLALGFSSMLADFLWHPLAGLLNQTQWAVTRLMLEATDRAADWSWGYAYVAQPAAWLIVAAYLAGLAAILWRKSRIWIGGGAAIVSAAMLLWMWIQPAERVTVLNVGGGQAILLERFGGPKILIDGGTRGQAHLIVEPFLRARGVESLDAVIATHGDAAHVAGLLEVVGDYPVAEVIVNPAKTRSSTYKKLAQAARDLKIPLVEAQAGDRLKIRGLELEVLWPRPPFGKKADENSLVVRYGNLVFLGDLPSALESRLTLPERATVIRGSSGGEHLGRAGLVIFSASDQDRDDLVSDALIQQLQGGGAAVWITGREGAAVLRRAREGWALQSSLARPSAGQ